MKIRNLIKELKNTLQEDKKERALHIIRENDLSGVYAFLRLLSLKSIHIKTIQRTCVPILIAMINDEELFQHLTEIISNPQYDNFLQTSYIYVVAMLEDAYIKRGIKLRYTHYRQLITLLDRFIYLYINENLTFWKGGVL